MAGFTYKSYNFVDKDPMIDQLRTVVEKAGVTYKALSDDSGVSPQTISNWFAGETRKPQAATMNAVLRAIGYRLGIVPIDAEDEVAFTKGAKVKVKKAVVAKARSPLKHVIQIAKYRRKVKK